MEQDQTKEQLRNRIEALESENKRLRENQEQSGSTRRRVLASMAGVATAGAMGLTAFSASAAAAPSGTNPVESDDPFFKLRLDRLRYIARDSAPSAPGSGRVVSYINSGDLP
jgi:hypothetical protein